MNVIETIYLLTNNANIGREMVGDIVVHVKIIGIWDVEIRVHALFNPKNSGQSTKDNLKKTNIQKAKVILVYLSYLMLPILIEIPN